MQQLPLAPMLYIPLEHNIFRHAHRDVVHSRVEEDEEDVLVMKQVGK